jgi:hypothetical protein
MKNIKTVASLTVLATALIATGAHANYEPQGIFGGRSAPDGSIYMTKGTVDQQSPIRGQSVADRPRPDFDATPIDVGSFQLFPSLSVGANYDSNIYATQTNEKSDTILKVNPSATLQSNWGRHALAATVVGDLNYYNHNSSENNTNAALQVEGRYDIARQTWLAGNLSQQRATEPRSNPSNPGSTAEPTQYDLTKFGVEAFRGAGLLSTKLEYDGSKYNYNDPNRTTGGKLDLVGRDRMQHKVTGEVGYEVSGNFKPFVRAYYDMRDYDKNPVRDSNGYDVVVGSKADFGGIVTAEAYVGYLAHDYEDFAKGDVRTMDFGGNVLWNVTTLTSVTLEVDRNLQETTTGGIITPTASTGYLSTGGSLTVTHELMRDLLVEAHADYTENDYNRAAGRTDELMGVGIGSRYFVNRNVFLDGTYDFSERDSNIAGSDYDKHIVFARVGAQY